MSNASALFRSLMVYGLCLPLAVALGYLLATPLDYTSLTVVGIILFILMIPLFLRWHHVWLIAAWNTSAVLFFLPGRPAVWMGVAAVSLAIGVLQYTVNRNIKFLYVPSLTWPLLFLTAVVLVTARLRGGIGLRAFGSEIQGGRNYVALLMTVVGYFALTSRQIPPKRAGLYVMLYFLGVASVAIGELPRVLPSSSNFLFLVFPVMSANALLGQGSAVAGPMLAWDRVTGLSNLGMGLFFLLLARYGIRGILLEPGKPWRLLALAACMAVALMSGFRLALLITAMTLAILFYLEGLHHTRLLPVLIVAALLGATLLTAFATHLPFGVQRSMAFLPIDIDPMARLSAQASSEWRLEIWRDVLPEVPQYLVLGKGYGFSGREMAMIHDARRGGSLEETTELAGDYHNGPLSLLIPLGVFGMIGFLWFLWGGARALYHNYQFGDPAYSRTNAFLLALFCVKVIVFFVIFGGFAADLAQFAGLVGLSVSVNGGVAKPVAVPEPKVVFNRFRLHPSVRRPISV